MSRAAKRVADVSLRRLCVCLALVFGALSGCSRGTFVPGGPHALAPGRLESIVRTYARANAVDAKLVLSVIDAESGGDPSAVSRAGAQGLMQLMPGTAAMYHIANPFDPYENVDGGTRFLHDLLRRYKGNVRLAVAAYNAGPGAVDAAHGIPPYAETRAYVDRVVAGIR